MPPVANGAVATVANFCTLNVAEHRAAGNVSCHSCKQAADARCTQLRNTAHWRCRGKNCNRAGGRWSLSAHTVRDANKRACRCTRLFLKSVKVYFWSLSDRSGSLEIAEQLSRSEIISDSILRLQRPCVHLSKSVACVWAVCAPVRLILASPSRRSVSPLNGPTPDATPLWDDVILRGLVRPAPRTDPRRNTPCGGDVILRGPCRSDSSRASPSEPSQTSLLP